MRWLSLVIALAWAAPAAAQHTTEVTQVHTLATCISEHHTHLLRLVRLLDEAHERLHATDAAVRRDAELSIESLLQRAAEAREELRACVEAADFTPPTGEVVVHETPADSAADHVAASGSSIHEVEANAAVAHHVRVVRGERVDGDGSVSDSAVVSAVHGTGSTLAVCYDDYVDRASSRSGTVHVSFTVSEGGHVTEATVERGGFDAPLRQCVQRAFRTMSVSGAHGRSVFAYEISLGS
jgi:TonB family protein